VGWLSPARHRRIRMRIAPLSGGRWRRETLGPPAEDRVYVSRLRSSQPQKRAADTDLWTTPQRAGSGPGNRRRSPLSLAAPDLVSRAAPDLAQDLGSRPACEGLARGRRL
jgi:hypothetical protein